ncbi:adenine deaminase [Thiorhodococcus minor]|uniref:Adenine deaminase n=1 Tax=Thiorhodococcus minor TaxID=57489 RepID=A0A6M0K840_9GAMM|nr:adenine deaminase [Thiorhodococcus minor]NEV64847.1 adenine deaminase [Thiorhodococcus minor]
MPQNISSHVLSSGELSVNHVDLQRRRIRAGRIRWADGIIREIEDIGPPSPEAGYLIPGFVDAHVHIESAMLPPSEFGRIALRHGTLASVSDPHEIANVLGIAGVRFMLEDAARTPFKILFGAPSCVPATPFETAGASLGTQEVAALLDEPGIGYLSEVMNFPGVLGRDPEVLAKIAAARERGLPVDGHAPGLLGAEAGAYAAAGISTDHECRTLREARDKIAAGMSILLREGSAARDFEALHPLISERPDRVMLCSDDKHPDDLVAGHIDRLAAAAIQKGQDPFDVLRCACINPCRHYGLDLGQLRVGDPMDAVLVRDLTELRPQRVWARGRLVAEEGRSLLPHLPVTPINRFKTEPIAAQALAMQADTDQLRVIDVVDGELVTHESLVEPLTSDGQAQPDTTRDLLTIAVLNRYRPAPPALGMVRGFGLKHGAIASSVAHDSHNLVAVGADRESLAAAINALIVHQGGIAVATGEGVEVLPLPLAGLMSVEDGDWVARRYAELDRQAKALGSDLRAPFMTLSFMALLVIPELKLSDLGLFDGRRFAFTELAVPA